MRNNPDDLANQTLNKIKKICRKNILEFKKFDDEVVAITSRKELSQEILNLIKKEVA